MSNKHGLADRGGATVFEKAEPCLRTLLTQHGVSHQSELALAVRGDVFRRAVLETAAADFPAANLEPLDHCLRSFGNPAFIPAMERVRSSVGGPIDPFATAGGVDAAIVLAGFGLPVAPFDVRRGILDTPSNDVDTVLALFSRRKAALVGYSACDAPFYVLITDCVRNLLNQILIDADLTEVKKLFERAGSLPPRDPGRSFVQGMALFARQAGDAIPTIELMYPNRTVGSITLYAGWKLDGRSCGSPNDGYFPFPMQLLRAVVTTRSYASSLSRRVGVPTPPH